MVILSSYEVYEETQRRECGLSEWRPNFGPWQIRDAEQLKPGTVIIEVNVQEKPSRRVLRILEPVKNGWLKVWWMGFTKTISLADHSIVPYAPSGLWNIANYLSFPMKQIHNMERRRYNRRNQLIAKNNI